MHYSRRTSAQHASNDSKAYNLGSKINKKKISYHQSHLSPTLKKRARCVYRRVRIQRQTPLIFERQKKSIKYG